MLEPTFVKFQHRGSHYKNRRLGAVDLGVEYVDKLTSKYALSEADLVRCFHYCKEIGIRPLCTA